MSEESLPQLTKAPIPVQTHTLLVEERLAEGKALRLERTLAREMRQY